MKKIIILCLALTSCTPKYYSINHSWIYKGKKEDITKQYPKTKELFDNNQMHKTKNNKHWREMEKYLKTLKNQPPQ